ncbi:ATPase domain-containing protein [Candidatus Hecatella orcuttiae]|uniref:ATPase domain-containing protein n=1 Tax=Candidatus Hecatella orcuttiae TaxID=1935119 RepID=UPI002867FC89|nr:ATPase domain-containing protein [Candidatus Hecatella orcuttiae]
MSLKRVGTGIPGLDLLIGGGFPRGSLILLAGNPGTGKTIFSARFLHSGAADHGENGLYVSFAESRESFYAHMRSFGFDFQKLEAEGKFKFLDALTVREEGVSTLLEEILDQVYSLKARRLVMDSFTALVQAFKNRIDARIILHTVLGKIVRQIGCTTLMVVEIPLGEERLGLGVEEFVADATLKLNRREHNDRLVREIEVLKFRGAEITQHRIPFTLKEGFQVFPPLTLRPVEEPVKFEVIPSTQTHLSTGIPDMDKALGGGIRKGTYNLVEVGRDVAFPLIRLVRPTVCNFTNQGHGVLILPPRGLSAPRIKTRLVPPLEEETFQQLVRVADFGDDVEDPYILKLKGESIEEDIETFWNGASQLREQTGKPVLSVVGFDSLEYIYGREEGLKILGQDITLVRNLEDVRVNVIRPTIALAEQLRAVSDLYFKVDEIDGALFMYGVKPKTPLYYFQVVTREGISGVKLTPMI